MVPIEVQPVVLDAAGNVASACHELPADLTSTRAAPIWPALVPVDTTVSCVPARTGTVEAVDVDRLTPPAMGAMAVAVPATSVAAFIEGGVGMSSAATISEGALLLPPAVDTTGSSTRAKSARAHGASGA